ncbi:redox-regulated ATPase YchF [Methanospirillum purgamenti]|jgi:ribosome-binding ATPase YchF (GTP1/OBG family)|uniref:Redox-regulated ATPase YchF n=1 Tax=Methanospirillum hungatei TaxID=2203 RepID=A0A8F5VNL8_METHU|nr:redox-regulated ATPase YchF [Methanospirillum hungatei]QXO96109.1 redox-regulated ATPase YchF [Methanospirillum hungatei]
MITLALAGKPNCGKSTLYRAATMAPAEIANYPFTTIDANRGVAYVRVPCPCSTLAHRCGVCADGIRYIAVHLIDVAGLVPEAHTGKGLGNQFLDHLRQADAIIQVIDASGSTDIEGNPDNPGTHDPLLEIPMLKIEMAMWLHGIIEKHWPKMQRQAQSRTFSIYAGLAEILAGLSIREEHVMEAEREAGIELRLTAASDLIDFSKILMHKAKPMIIAGNKADLASPELLEKVKGSGAILTSGAAELALRTAATSQMIAYHPGDKTFSIPDEGKLSEAQKAGLMKMKSYMDEHGGTGVQDIINRAVFDLLDMIVLYPVEDETHLTDGQGRVLPDAFLMKKGTTPHDLAFQVHSDIGNGFLYAIDAKTKMRIKESAILKDGDIIKIVSTAK